MKHILYTTLLLSLFVSCKKEVKAPETIKKTGLITQNAMVVSARVEASKIGNDILKKGGNAFDAMAATELALAVAYPYAGNLGGGGFMVYRKANGETGAIDYREKAPMAATKNMYLDKDGNVIPEKSTIGAMAVGVPGTVAGVFEVHKKLGSLPIEDILNPVIALAKKGVLVTEKQEKRIAHYQPLFKKANKDSILFDKAWKANDTIKHPNLAETLERILEHGKDGFYKGETAKTLANFVQENGGIITEEDLASYEPNGVHLLVFLMMI
ncbi:gamma-glutamyltranspeptidase [Algibacter lectus]|uniref:Gamma-glutamyltranspeptidase n=1 Tax=Algibacter lectus TaxID=221126 RepID=A0A090VEL1_9FLAO|nr:gamma-glutamyltranspeptidase [Algibacter lectus]